MGSPRFPNTTGNVYAALGSQPSVFPAGSQAVYPTGPHPAVAPSAPLSSCCCPTFFAPQPPAQPVAVAAPAGPQMCRIL